MKMMESIIKKRLISAINDVIPLSDYSGADIIYSEKYNATPTDMVYILLNISKEFNFIITDDFVDGLEMCTFDKLEELLEQYENSNQTKTYGV